MDFFTALGCLYLFYCLGMKKLKILQRNDKRAEKYAQHVLRPDDEDDEEEDEYYDEEVEVDIEFNGGTRKQLSTLVNDEAIRSSRPLMMGKTIDDQENG